MRMTPRRAVRFWIRALLEFSRVASPWWLSAGPRVAALLMLAASTAWSQTPCPTWSGPWQGKLGKYSSRFSPRCMSDAEIESLIALGKKYKTIDKLWDDEFVEKEVEYEVDGRTASSRSGTGDEFNASTWFTGTTLRALTDSWKIASASFQANHELESFSVADARRWQYGYFTIAVASSDAGPGQNATRNVHAVLQLVVPKNKHAVLQIGDEFLQPTSKNELSSTLSELVHVGVIFWLQKNSTMSAAFSFVLPNPCPPMVRLVLIDNQGEQHARVIDFSKLR
jgi:hypothetical protein